MSYFTKGTSQLSAVDFRVFRVVEGFRKSAPIVSKALLEKRMHAFGWELSAALRP
jgi:RIO-like serine/threonine protein kinase